jgi:hypothetical protein
MPMFGAANLSPSVSASFSVLVSSLLSPLLYLSTSSLYLDPACGKGGEF